MWDSFEEPEEIVSGPRLNPKDIEGHLLIVQAIDYIAHSPTKYSRPDKPSDAVVVDVIDLDLADPETGYQGLLARKCWWRQARLIQQLKPKIGGNPLVARMGRGIPANGMQPPFELFSMSQDPECMARVRAWVSAHPEHRPSTPGQSSTNLPTTHLDDPWATSQVASSQTHPHTPVSTPHSAPPSSHAYPTPLATPVATPPPPPPPPAASAQQRDTVLSQLRRSAGIPQPGVNDFQGTDPAYEEAPF